MCGGGGGFLGAVTDVVNTVVDTVTQPIENTINSVETLVTDPTKLTIGNVTDLVVPVGGALVRDAIDNPDHAVVQATAILGGAAAGGAFSAAPVSAIGADGFATGAAHVSVAPTLTPISADLAAAPLGGGILSSIGSAALVSSLVGKGAAGGPVFLPRDSSGGGLLQQLPGMGSILPALTGIGQKAQDILVQIPGLSEIPVLSGLVDSARAAEAPGGFNVSLGPNEAVPTPAPKDQARSLLVGVAVVALPLGGVAWLAWKAYKRAKRA